MTADRRHCRCGKPLARDNAGTICAVCQQKPRRYRAPDVPAEFWQTEVMVDALASGDLGRVIRAYRSHPFHGHKPLSQTVIADWLHVSQTSLSRIERGQCRLTVDDINSFARSLGVPWTLRWAPQRDMGEDVDPLSRRSLFGAGVGAVVGLSATTAPAAARDVDPELVAHWLDLLALLESHDASFGPHQVLPAVRREIGLIGNHRQIARGELQHQLLRVEAHWAEFVSFLYDDIGDPRLRDSWADQALRLAQEAGYRDMVAYVLMRHSQWHAMRDDADRAIGFAQAALRTRGASNHIRALCALKEAQGHALIHDGYACERSLTCAYGLLDHAGSGQMTWSDLGRRETSPSSVLAYDARCWLWLQPRKAVTMFEDVLHQWPSDSMRSRGVHHARLALACAAADETERAATEGVKALNIARTTKSDAIVRELKRLDRQLAGCDLPAGADFREAFAAL